MRSPSDIALPFSKTQKTTRLRHYREAFRNSKKIVQQRGCVITPESDERYTVPLDRYEIAVAMQEAQKEQAAKDGKPYYDNDLVVAKADGAPIAASWVSSQFGKLLEDLEMQHIRFHDLRHPNVKPKTQSFIHFFSYNFRHQRDFIPSLVILSL